MCMEEKLDEIGRNLSIKDNDIIYVLSGVSLKKCFDTFDIKYIRNKDIFFTSVKEEEYGKSFRMAGTV